MDLHLLFPSFIGESVNESPIQDEYDYILNAEYSEHKKVNRTEPYILDKTPHLKAWLAKEVDFFAKEALACEDPLHITQSWAIKTQSLHGLQCHMHPNSVVSGAYFIQVEDDSPGTTFYRPDAAMGADRHLNTAVFYRKTPGYELDKHWLRDAKTYPAVNHHLFLFKSNMPHGVNVVNSDKIRCVVSFNTWFVNGFGSSELLTEAW